LKQFIYLLLVLIALLFTILVRQTIPDTYFESYILELDSVWDKEEAEQDYLVDINNDQTPEKIRHHNINSPGHSVELWRGNKLNLIYIFRDNEQFISKTFTFADIDGNKTKELLFVSVKNNSAYLNILAYNEKTKLLYPIEKIAIDSISLHNDKPDVANNFIMSTGSTIYFDLQGGYSVKPRNIYKYDFEQKKLIKTKLNSLVTPEVQPFSYKGKDLLLATYVRSTGNTISNKEADAFRNTTNKDSIESYKTIKHLEYTYGDFASYILLYNAQLDFEFAPIEFFGWTNFTKSVLVDIDGVPHIVAFTNAQIDEPENKRCKLVTVCNLQGKVLKQIKLPHNYSDIFTQKGKLIFYADKTLFLNNEKLELQNELTDIAHPYGFVDIDKDKNSEFVAFRNNVLTVFSENFSVNATFKIDQEFTPFPENKQITVLNYNANNYLFYNTRLFYYLFSFSKNELAFLKYPFYILVFAFWLILLVAVLKLNNRKLEKDKLRLEAIVAERTMELATKNKELEKLDLFKRTLTSTLVHDLKNPLGQILVKTNDKIVNNLAGRMLLLITNLLDVDKYEQSEFKLNKEWHPLNELIDQALSSIEISLVEKNLKITIQTADLTVLADKELVVRILENLLTNAIRFSPLNQTIEITANKIEENKIAISIKNYGENIPENALHVIFDKYVQLTKADTKAYKSSGLGLAFCRMAVEAHGQTIDAKNVEGAVVFTFTLEGKTISDQTLKQDLEQQNTVLTEHEIALLKPWMLKLAAIQIYQVSDIMAILTQIPNETENINLYKQQITDAVFASNATLYLDLVDLKQ